MEETNGFINALENWSKTAPVIQDYKTLLILLSMKIGEVDPFSKDPLNDLKNRINHLVTVERFDEGFLIGSLVSVVTTMLKNILERHGDRLVFQERMSAKMGDDNPFKEQIEKLRNPAYMYWATCELDSWNQIVAVELGVRKKLEWEQQRERDFMSKRHKLTDIPVPLRDIPLGKLAKRASLSDLHAMSEMDAFRLRKDINTDDESENE